MIFNTFVFMQVFNEINARKIKSTEYNVFEGFFNNFLFLLIEIITITVQIAFIHFGGRALKVTRLSVNQHLICALIGLFSLVVGFICKLLPKRLFAFSMDEERIEKSEFISKLRTKSLRIKPISRMTTGDKLLTPIEKSRIIEMRRSKTFIG